MNLLLNEPVKCFKKGKPSLTYEHEELLKKKIKGFKQIQKDYVKYVKNLLKQGIEEYKAGKIML